MPVHRLLHGEALARSPCNATLQILERNNARASDGPDASRDDPRGTKFAFYSSAVTLINDDLHNHSIFNRQRGLGTMNISYDLEFDMDSFLSDLERRQSARKRVRLEELKKEVRRLKNERKSRGEIREH